MAAGYHDFTAGEVLTAANLEDYCQNQTVMRFADSSSRDTALSSVKTEGMLSFQLDTNTATTYSGTAWSTFGPLFGTGTAWTPTLTQSGSVAITGNDSVYWRIGRLVLARFKFTVNATGTGGNAVTVSTPVTMWTSDTNTTVGVGQIFDSSASASYMGMAVPSGTGAIQFRPMNATTGSLGSGTFTAAIANPDAVTGWMLFEAAADA